MNRGEEKSMTEQRLIDANELLTAFPCGETVRTECVRATIGHMPTIEERKVGTWTTEEVAELLFNMFGEECACNFNGIDEWLPERCKYAETTCPEPKEKHGCWMQFLLQGGA